MPAGMSLILLNTMLYMGQSHVLPLATFCTPSCIFTPWLTADMEFSDCGGLAPGGGDDAVHPTRHLCACDLDSAHRQLSVDVNYYSPYKCYFLYNPLKQEAANRPPCHVTS